jgi:hypothetical protein
MVEVSTIRTKLSDIRYNLLSSKVKEKLVVIESDDWGSLRVRDRKSYQSLLNSGFHVDQCPFNINDRLESASDIEGLVELLENHRGSDNKPAVITTNILSANPDFESIKTDKYENYHWKPFWQSYHEYNDCARSFDYLKAAQSKGVFYMQFHGMEHVHVNNWMAALRHNEAKAIAGFEFGMFSVSGGFNSTCKKEYLDAWGIYNTSDYDVLKERITIGLKLFNEVWGYDSQTVMAPCYIWSDQVENILFNNSVKGLQSGKAQLSVSDNGTYKGLRRYLGKKNRLGQRYLVRNVFFEPSVDLNIDVVDKALKSISNAFTFNAPAIINSHRLNYIGGINQENRTRGLNLLKNGQKSDLLHQANFLR